MKHLKRSLLLLLISVLLLQLVPCAFAEDGPVVSDPRFDGKTWDEVIDDFFNAHTTDRDGVTLGYMNTVTGEQHFYQGDRYMVSGSMYKVPINMLYTEKIYNGEMTLDTSVGGVAYGKLLEWTIVNSDNDSAKRLWDGCGSYHHYRELICPYMGEDAETVDAKFYENNFFTAEQMIHCLNLLATESERFPGVIDMMLKAEPSNYFKLHTQDYTIAHKYGYNTEGYTLFLNDCAICYTDDPIVIVMFTETIGDTYIYGTLSDYCTLMCDYAQYHTAIRKAEEAKAAEEEALRQLELQNRAQNDPGTGPQGNSDPGNSAGTAEPSGNSGSSDPVTLPPVNNKKDEGVTFGSLILSGLIVVIAAVFITVMLTNKKRLHAGWGAAAVVFTALALLLCVHASRAGMLVSKLEGDPRETAERFFTAIDAEQYDLACSYLRDYDSLGLGSEPADEASSLINDALKDSYSWKLYGDCEVSGLNATQTVIFTYLDLSAIDDIIVEKTADNMNSFIATRSNRELYDNDGKFFSSVTDEAYSLAVNYALSRASDYYVTVAFNLELVYSDNEWRILTDQSLLNALVGGISY